jgi:hypothetical protein
MLKNMKTLKVKLIWALVIGLSVLQFSLTVLMVHESHESFCVFDEQCILQSVADHTEAIQPLVVLLLPVFFVFISLIALQPKAIRISSSPPNHKFLQALGEIVKRE